MRTVVQRVKKASVSIDGSVVGSIGQGLAVLLGIGSEDTIKDMDYLIEKLVKLRVFDDEEGKMNISLLDSGGELLVVSQFTLYGDCRKGRRPSYDKAARPEIAKELYEEFVKRLKQQYDIKVETGVFQADMTVEIHNDGPVTLLLDSNRQF